MIDLEKDIKLSVFLPANQEVACRCAHLAGLVDVDSESNNDQGDVDDGQQEVEEEDVDDALVELNRDFAFPGETAMFYVVIERVHDEEKKTDLDMERFNEICCRDLELLLNSTDDGCRVSSVLLCPTQPTRNDKHFFSHASALYYFQVMMPTSLSTELAHPPPNDGNISVGEIGLNLYCRLKSTSTKSLFANVARQLNLACLQQVDSMLDDTIPQAQEILFNDELDQNMTSQTLQIKRTIRKVRCISVRTRFEQVNGHCFIEVCCENVHQNVTVVLKDLTLHTFSNQPINMKVKRVGRWVLPLQLYPGERQSVCFMLSDFQDALPHLSWEEKGMDNKNSSPQSEDPAGTKTPTAPPLTSGKYTSIATVTWSSDVTKNVRGEYRIEWEFASGILDDPIFLKLAHYYKEDATNCIIKRGQQFRMTLIINNRSTKKNELHVVCPIPENIDTNPIIPINANIYVGPVTRGVVHVPLSFMALETCYLDLAKMIHVYDALADNVIAIKEPKFVSVFYDT